MAPVNRTDQLPRLLPGTAATLTLDEHLARYGPLPLRPAGDLIAEVRAAGLTGRGGAAFPAGTKLAAVAAAAAATARPGRPRRRTAAAAFIVANGVESEPGSDKDAVLLARSPHLVLDGIAAGRPGHRRKPGLAVPARGPAPAGRQLRGRDRRAGPGRAAPVPVLVEAIPGGYLASQETALVSWLSGGPQQPSFVPPRPAEPGRQRPAHAGAEHRDPGASRAHRPVRRGLVPLRRASRRRPGRRWSR